MDAQLNGMRKMGADFLLLVVTLFWGITFVVVKDAIQRVGVFVFLSQRFSLAFLILLILCLLRRKSLPARVVKQGVVLGVVLFGGFAFQTIALLYTTASNTAFLTGLNVVLVPVVAALLFSQRVTPTMILGVILAAVGLFSLCTNGHWIFNVGDLLASVCGVCVALHVLFTGEYAKTGDVYWLTTVQLAVVALLSIGGAWLVGDGRAVIAWYPEILEALVICVVFATIFAFVVQTSMQRFTTPTHTALIFCMEPVFAALFAYMMIDERWGPWGIAGAVLILSGMVVSEISCIDALFIRRQAHTSEGVLKT